MDNAFRDLIKLWKQGTPAVLATVVRGRGPTYRKPGASAVITEGLQVVGAISGGCLEQDVLEVADAVRISEKARLLSYDTGTDEDLMWGTGTGCGGQIDVLVAPVAPPVIAFLAARLDAGGVAAIASVISGPALGGRLASTGEEHLGDLGRNAANDMAIAAMQSLLEQRSSDPVWLIGPDGWEIFIQPVLPPPLLVVVGAGDDARPVISLAKMAGFRVAVVDHRPAWLTAERFPDADRLMLVQDVDEADGLLTNPDIQAVIMSHHFQRDLDWLRKLLAFPIWYVGLLGAHQRSQKLIELLLEEEPGMAEQTRAKLHAPVGLDIGADGPAQIAVSIVAELIAARTGRSGTSLSRK